MRALTQDFFGSTLGRAEQRRQQTLQQREYRDALLQQMQQREAAKQQQQQQQKLEEMEYRRKLELEIEAEKVGLVLLGALRRLSGEGSSEQKRKGISQSVRGNSSSACLVELAVPQRQRDEEEAKRQERARQLQLQQEAAAAAAHEHQMQMQKARRCIDLDAERARAGLPKLKSQLSGEALPPASAEASSIIAGTATGPSQHSLLHLELQQLQRETQKIKSLWEAEHSPQLKASASAPLASHPTPSPDPRLESLQAELRHHAEEVRFLQQQQQQIFQQQQQQLLQRLQQEELLRFLQWVHQKQGASCAASANAPTPSSQTLQASALHPLLEQILPKILAVCAAAADSLPSSVAGVGPRTASQNRTAASPDESLSKDSQRRLLELLLALLQQTGGPEAEAFLQLLQKRTAGDAAPQRRSSQERLGGGGRRRRSSGSSDGRVSSSSERRELRGNRWGPRPRGGIRDCPRAKFFRSCHSDGRLEDPEERPLPTTVKRQVLERTSFAAAADPSSEVRDPSRKTSENPATRESGLSARQSCRNQEGSLRHLQQRPRGERQQALPESSASAFAKHDAEADAEAGQERTEEEPRWAVEEWISRGLRRRAASAKAQRQRRLIQSETQNELARGGRLWHSSSSSAFTDSSDDCCNEQGTRAKAAFWVASSSDTRPQLTTHAGEGGAQRLPQFSIFIDASRLSEAASAAASSTLSARSTNVGERTTALAASHRNEQTAALTAPLNDSFRFSCIESLESTCTYTCSGESEAEGAPQVYAHTLQRASRQQRRGIEDRLLLSAPHLAMQRAMERQLALLQRHQKQQKQPPQERVAGTVGLQSLPPSAMEPQPKASPPATEDAVPGESDAETEDALPSEAAWESRLLRRAMSATNPPLALQRLRRKEAAIDAASQRRPPAERVLFLAKKAASGGEASSKRLCAADRFTDRLSWEADASVPLEEWQLTEPLSLRLNQRLSRQQLRLYGNKPFLDPLPPSPPPPTPRARPSETAGGEEEGVQRQLSTSRGNFGFPNLLPRRSRHPAEGASDATKEKEGKSRLNQQPKDSPVYTPAVPPQPHAPPLPREVEKESRLETTHSSAESAQQHPPKTDGQNAAPEENPKPEEETPPAQNRESLRRRSRLRLWRRAPH